MDDFDLDVRRQVYFSVVANGRPPSAQQTAVAMGASEDEIVSAYGRLHDAHALVLHPGTTDIWMANPFCFAPPATTRCAVGAKQNGLAIQMSVVPGCRTSACASWRRP